MPKQPDKYTDDGRWELHCLNCTHGEFKHNLLPSFPHRNSLSEPHCVELVGHDKDGEAILCGCQDLKTPSAAMLGTDCTCGHPFQYHGQVEPFPCVVKALSTAMVNFSDCGCQGFQVPPSLPVMAGPKKHTIKKVT